VGYLLFVYGQTLTPKLNLVAIAVVGVAIAFLHVYLLGDRAVQQRGTVR